MFLYYTVELLRRILLFIVTRYYCHVGFSYAAPCCAQRDVRCARDAPPKGGTRVRDARMLHALFARGCDLLRCATLWLAKRKGRGGRERREAASPLYGNPAVALRLFLSLLLILLLLRLYCHYSYYYDYSSYYRYH